MNAVEQYSPVVLFIMLYKVILTFESVAEILWCNHSNESYWAVLSCGTVYYAVQGDSNFWVCGWNPMVWPFKWKLLSSTLLWYCLLCCTSWFWPLNLWMKYCSVTIQVQGFSNFWVSKKTWYYHSTSRSDLPHGTICCSALFWNFF